MTKAISNKNHWEKVMSNKVNKFISIFEKCEKDCLIEKYSEINLIKKILEKNKIDIKWKTFFEVWCAPWLYSYLFNKIFWVIPWWIEYTDNGFTETKQLFDYFKFPTDNLIKWDFFEFKNKTFDILFSAGFIEHFDNPKNVIQKHINLTNKWWLIIIIIPNYHIYFKTIQKLLNYDLIVNQHNTKIMNIDAFKNLFKGFDNLEKLYIWEIWKARLWQLVAKNNFLQKVVYGFDLIFDKIKLYKLLHLFLPKKLKYQSLIFIWKKVK